MFLSITFFVIIITGCQRRTVTQPETAVPVIEAAGEYVFLQDESETQAAIENSAREHLSVREVSPYKLRNVLPNSWRKLTALTEVERQAFIQENSTVFSQIEMRMRNNDLDWFDGSRFEHYFIFRQQVGKDTFYRVLVTADSNPDFLSRYIRFKQFLVYQSIILNVHNEGSYNRFMHTQHEHLAVFFSIDIISGRENAKGILVTELRATRNHSNPNELSGFRNGQLVGGNSSSFFLIEEVLKRAAGESHSVIRIDASSSLVDPNIPLRYSLQNAFDGNPETAFIANTEDGLMKIRFELGRLTRKLAIINGHASNKEMYYANNRVRTIAREGFGLQNEIIQGDRFYLNDSTLTFQVIDFVSNGFIWVVDLYRGARYNNAVISGLNVKLDDGWLFGEIDE